MSPERLKTVGKFLRGLQTHRLNGFFSPQQFVRVTFTHEVYKEHEDNFEDIVAYLTKSYEAITAERFFRIIKREEPLAGQYMLMTFDDGLMSSYRAIKTTLNKYGVKAVVFVPTQILELKTRQDMKRFTWQNIGFHDDEAPSSLREEAYLTMGAQELLDLQKDGHAVFPHTHSHKRLIEVCTPDIVADEIVKPRKILEDLLQSPMNAFAFPVGTESVVSSFCFPHIKREYDFCFSALGGKNTSSTDPHILHRDSINADYDMDHLRNLEEGVFDLYYGYKLAMLKQAFNAT
jgi:peptidoglycan/xylan/chitin deacetylase (PgdA/CDA1 family)